ncbi:addiction module protein [Alienimonas chondri]|uniref:Uncharacterized protein n=1 Tax=Alienimonas chondri TaxID=2681879 RepID=A0ABX1VJT2_9PLAN|nr:addiction module protein [Alienimonas chondri]NNJ28134.1 hypothetical protein [Alienimonas chondri]
MNVADRTALSPAAEAVRSSLLALPAEDRAAVLDAVAMVEGTGSDPPSSRPAADSPLGRRQRAELDRRLAAMDAGEVETSPWSEVSERARGMIRVWERERAEGKPYTPYQVAGREVSPGDSLDEAGEAGT